MNTAAHGEIWHHFPLPCCNTLLQHSTAHCTTHNAACQRWLAVVTALFASSLSFLISPLSFPTIYLFLPCSSSTFVPLTFRNYKHVFPFLSVLYRVRGRQDSLLSLMITFFYKDLTNFGFNSSRRFAVVLSCITCCNVPRRDAATENERDAVTHCNMHCNTHCNMHCNMQSLLDEEKLPLVREKGVLHNTSTHTAPHTQC